MLTRLILTLRLMRDPVLRMRLPQAWRCAEALK